MRLRQRAVRCPGLELFLALLFLTTGGMRALAVVLSLLVALGLSHAETGLVIFGESPARYYADSSHPDLICATCWVISPTGSACGECPFLEEIYFCDILTQFEHVFNGSLSASTAFPVELADFKSACNEGTGPTASELIGTLEDGLLPPALECMACGLVVQALKYVNDHVIPTIMGILAQVCGGIDIINGCSDDILQPIFLGLLESLGPVYHLIGVNLLGCPEYTQYLSQCVPAPTTSPTAATSITTGTVLTSTKTQ